MKTFLACLIVALPVCSGAGLPEWPQFGGPFRNFTVDTKGLAATWPSTGPKKLWERPLGEGYSAIAADNGMLYTMYRKGDNEVAVALDAATGKTLWEYSYSAGAAMGASMLRADRRVVGGDFHYIVAGAGDLFDLRAGFEDREVGG